MTSSIHDNLLISYEVHCEKWKDPRAGIDQMTSSIHDNLLISYEVHCEKRIITLRTEYRIEHKPTEFTNVVFEGVQGYRFENDAFGNIILDVSPMSVEQFLAEYGAEVSESYRMAGSPGPWAANLDSATMYLRERAIKGFILSSSHGLSGWVLAEKFSISPDRKTAVPV